VIAKELVRVDWEVISKASYEIDGNINLSARGLGRADIIEIGGKTKSGRTKLKFRKPL